jgi:hypothetical protein
MTCMAEPRVPITAPADLTDLDPVDLLEGYNDGLAGEAEPGDNRSPSYWHGWRNGAVDGGHREKDEAQAILAKAVVGRWRDRK